jgi:hypothetical protein
MPIRYGKTKHDREIARDARRQEKLDRRRAKRGVEDHPERRTSTQPHEGDIDWSGPKVETPRQTPTLWPEAPEPVAGVARVLSNGGPL